MNATLDEAVRAGIAFIEENLQNNISVRDVADAVHFSQFYFSREFSRRTRISVYDYIVRRKISEAYQALFLEKPGIADLAFRYGFQSHEVFTRTFRKVIGVNPSEAGAYRSLAVYGRLEEAYLAYLSGLDVEQENVDAEDVFFRVQGPSTLDGEGDRLILLEPENLLNVRCVFSGQTGPRREDTLSFALTGLKRGVRIRRPGLRYAFRFFTDYAYDPAEMRCNYILLKQTDARCVDILTPCR